MKHATLMSLKTRFFLVTVVTTLAVALAVIVANQLTNHMLQKRFLETTIGSKKVFWKHIVQKELDQMQAQGFAITRDGAAMAALAAGNTKALAQQVEPTYSRLQATGVLTKLQITDAGGRILVSFPGGFDGVSRKSIIDAAIGKGKVMRGIERDDDGELVAVVAYPLYEGRGRLVGVSVFARNLLGVLETYMEHDNSISFIADAGSIIGLPAESEILPDVRMQIPAPGQDAYSVERIHGKAYQVTVLAIDNYRGNPLAHIVAFTDFTESFTEERAINYLVYAIIILMLIASVIWLYWFVVIESARLHARDRKVNEELAVANHKLQEAVRVKSEFLANMSHELRTPLNSIIGFSGAMLKGIDGELNEDQRTSVTYVYNSGQHLLDLINDVLDLSKIEAGKMVLNLETVDLPRLVEDSVRTVGVIFRSKTLRLRTELPEEIPVIYGDNTRIKQVLLNILSNAAKFTDKGEVVVSCSVVPVDDPVIPDDHTAPTPGQTHWVLFATRDTGIGIREADQATVFEEFRQIDGSTTRKYSGTGLGMAISRRIVQLHGGHIWLESTVGVGTTFFFTLPHLEEDVLAAGGAVRHVLQGNEQMDSGNGRVAATG